MMRMMTITQLSLAVFIVAAVVRSVLGAERPNIVLIMTDNHGPWTLGCYGNEEIRLRRAPCGDNSAIKQVRILK